LRRCPRFRAGPPSSLSTATSRPAPLRFGSGATPPYFGLAATLPEHRGKGGQGALFAARIEHALGAGCRTLVTETGELRDDLPGASYRNILRYGFEERHVVAHRLRPRRG